MLLSSNGFLFMYIDFDFLLILDAFLVIGFKGLQSDYWITD